MLAKKKEEKKGASRAQEDKQQTEQKQEKKRKEKSVEVEANLNKHIVTGTLATPHQMHGWHTHTHTEQLSH
jgi:hypothetical protein